MKIAYITDAWLPIWGGGQEHVFQVAKRLNADIIYPKSNFFNFWGRVLFCLWTIKFYLTSNYDLYHSHSFSTNVFLPLAKLRGKKTAVTIHGTGKEIIGGGILNTFKITNFLAWLVLYVWPYDFRFSASTLKGYITVGNGVNINEFDKVKRIPHEDFRIFWIGRRFDPIKGVEFLEQAVKEINDPKIVLDIVEGVYGEEKINRFKQADLFVLPSLSEGLPIVLLEAMAAKLPIVATSVGDIPKIITDGVNGFLVKPGNVVSLAQGIKKMIRNKKLNLMTERAYQLVKKNYSWDNVARKVYEKYNFVPNSDNPD